MPKDFDDCVKAGGRVRTRSLSGGRYQKICYRNGEAHPGHVQHRRSDRKDLARELRRNQSS